MKLYLAGPMTGCSVDTMSGWRDQIVEDFARTAPNIECLSPLRGSMCEGERAEFYRDCWDIQQSDVVLANLENTTRVSIGTVMELMYARLLGKYVIAVLDERHDHLFVRECVCYRADTPAQAKAHIVTSFGGK